MPTMPISKFKTHALKIIAQIAETRQSVVITRRGVPIARVVPFQDEDAPVPGQLAHTLVFEDDILSPLGEKDWEACR